MLINTSGWSHFTTSAKIINSWLDTGCVCQCLLRFSNVICLVDLRGFNNLSSIMFQNHFYLFTNSDVLWLCSLILHSFPVIQVPLPVNGKSKWLYIHYVWPSIVYKVFSSFIPYHSARPPVCFGPIQPSVCFSLLKFALKLFLLKVLSYFHSER